MSHRAGTSKRFVNLQKTQIFCSGSSSLIVLPLLFGAELLMRASVLLVLHIIHILIFISHLPIIYMEFFFFNFRVGLVGLWLFLNLHRGSSTTPTHFYPYNTETFLQTAVPSIPSKSCCCFLWNTSGAKHNLSAACGNGVSQRGCWLCIKVGSVFQGTCQNLADIFSIWKYLALDSCSKDFTLVGSKKCSLFKNIFI